MTTLSPKKELFCREYVATGSAKTAFISSGYKAGKSSIEKQVSEILTDADIQARLQELESEKYANIMHLSQRVSSELEKIAFADESSDIRVSTRDKVSALSELAKILGMKSDFNTAIATLRNYGIMLIPENGKWITAEQYGKSMTAEQYSEAED